MSGDLKDNENVEIVTDDKASDKKQLRAEKRRRAKEKVVAFAKRALKAFDGALYPLDCTCDVCGEELVENTRYRLCSHCIETLPFVKEHKCLCCGAPLKDEADYCNRCQYERGVFDKNRSPLAYDGDTKRMIYALKFGKKKYMAQTLGALMADTFINESMEGEIIVFVPMTSEEEKKRGFNQSELLAQDVGKRLDIPVLPALVKIKDTKAQKELQGKDRAKNLEGAFACVFEQVKNRKILLVDDIFTTGATANECSKVLLRAGARSVSVLTSAVAILKIPVESNDGTVQI